MTSKFQQISEGLCKYHEVQISVNQWRSLQVSQSRVLQMASQCREMQKSCRMWRKTTKHWWDLTSLGRKSRAMSLLIQPGLHLVASSAKSCQSSYLAYNFAHDSALDVWIGFASKERFFATTSIFVNKGILWPNLFQNFKTMHMSCKAAAENLQACTKLNHAIYLFNLCIKRLMLFKVCSQQYLISKVQCGCRKQTAGEELHHTGKLQAAQLTPRQAAGISASKAKRLRKKKREGKA